MSVVSRPEADIRELPSTLERGFRAPGGRATVSFRRGFVYKALTSSPDIFTSSLLKTSQSWKKWSTARLAVSCPSIPEVSGKSTSPKTSPAAAAAKRNTTHVITILETSVQPFYIETSFPTRIHSRICRKVPGKIVTARALLANCHSSRRIRIVDGEETDFRLHQRLTGVLLACRPVFRAVYARSVGRVVVLAQ